MAVAVVARWYLVGALPEERPVAHVMTRAGDLRYRRSACGERESRTWTAVDLESDGVEACPRCAGAIGRGEEQLAFDLPLGREAPPQGL
ncbi:hypothetical protein [Amycolatopsis benzoatilytica]|uniref:hypothetical protein n=1 Tax=Amycolatopsis benzoatilytica TaxID=346045 RepID=UPI0003621DAF|nr:hypothetical protein [Amycolatopsis benzoatilytica]